MYVPNTQLPDSLAPLAARGFGVVVRSSSATAEALGSLRAALREYDSGQVMICETAMEKGIARSLAGRRFSLILLGSFALLALTLATVGIYGLASYLATERTYEIGVRMAPSAATSSMRSSGLLGEWPPLVLASGYWPRSAWRAWSPECCSTPAGWIH